MYQGLIIKQKLQQHQDEVAVPDGVHHVVVEYIVVAIEVVVLLEQDVDFEEDVDGEDIIHTIKTHGKVG